MTTFITIPGIDGSGLTHWQTHWEAADPSFRRFAPSSWEHPRLDDWIDALEHSVRTTPGAVLVAHSLGCLLVVHWANRSTTGVAGAFLVSVPDPNGSVFPHEAFTFHDVPLASLPFPALVLSSSTDQFGTLEYQKATASAWGASHIHIGAHGHINEASGLGSWPQGRELLTAFAAGLR
jgi:predicted alpha/beta hydrolase family esterase